MIAKLVSFALQQRFLIVIASIALMVWGAVSFQKLPIDAYPDLSPTHVVLITQWPGHAAEEIELIHYIGSNRHALSVFVEAFEAKKVCLLDGQGNGMLYVDAGFPLERASFWICFIWRTQSSRVAAIC